MASAQMDSGYRDMLPLNQMTIEQVCAEFSTEIAAVLRKQKVDGSVLLTATDAALQRVGLTILQVDHVLCKRDELLKASKKTDNKSVEDDIESDILGQEPRKFLQTKEQMLGLQYVENAVLPPESACCSIEDRTIEYKSLRSCSLNKSDKNYIEKPLVDRLGKFLIGCMNASFNGTISFGVCDDIEDREQAHGSVKGIKIPKDKRAVIIGIVEKHFMHRNPQQFQNTSPAELSAIQRCLKPPVFIPVTRVNDGQDDYVVIEFDVNPESEICGSNIFSLQVPKPGAQKNQTEKIYYLRLGTSSYKWEERYYKELQKRVEDGRRLRKDEESEMKTGVDPSKVQASLVRLLCRGHPKIDDQDNDYVLVIDQVTSTKEVGQWIPLISWSFILDFDPSSRLYNDTKENFKVEPFLLRFGDVTKSKSDEKFRKSVQFGHRAAWISCINQNMMKPQDWLKKARNSVVRTLNAFTDKGAIKSHKRLVFIFLVETTKYLENMFHVITDVYGIVETPSQILVITNNATVKRELQDKMGTLMPKGVASKHCFKISGWNFLSNIMRERIDQPTVTGGFRIPCSSGEIGIEVSYTTIMKFKEANLTILAGNHETSTITDDYQRSQAIESFLKGERPTWDVFLPTTTFGNGQIPVKRLLVDDIVRDVRELSEGRSSSVELKRVVHQSGSGATTLCMGVLWRLKLEFRCAVSDGESIRAHAPEMESEISLLADRIMRYRDLGEDSKARDNYCPLLIMLDNANDEMAWSLKSALEQNLRELDMNSKKTQIVVVFLTHGNYVDYSNQLTPISTTYISQRLYQGEKDWFEQRLKEISEVVKPETILGFVLLASNFDTKQEYLENVIDSALQDIEHIPPRQVKLLLYLAVLGHYCKEACYTMPESLCRRFLDPRDRRSQKDFIQLLAEPIRLFVIRVPDSYSQQHSIRILHVKLAQVLLKKLSSERKSSAIVLDMLKEKVLFNQRYQVRSFHNTMRRFLVFRATNNDTRARGYHEKEEFSDLIKSLIEANESQDAIEVLKRGNEALCEEEKWFVAQALARLYTNCGDYEKAAEWGTRAISDAHGTHNEFACYDTLGQIYKRQLKKVQQRLESNYSVEELRPVLDLAVRACNHFQEARKLFQAKFIANENINPSIFISQRLLGDSQALDGIAETSLIVISLILKSKLFKCSTSHDAKNKFLDLIRNGSTSFGVLEKHFSDEESEWINLHDIFTQYQGFLSNIYTSVKHCLADGVRRLTQSNILAKNIGTRCQMFKEWFSEDVMQNSWKRIVKSKIMTWQEKLFNLQPYKDLLVIHDFKFALELGSHPGQTVIRNFQDLIVEVIHLNDENDLSLSDYDKICYITVYFVLVIKGRRHLKLQEDRVADISLNLVSSKELRNLHPEWCVMFLALHWPPNSSVDCDSLPKNIEDKFHDCLRWLHEYQRNLKGGKPFAYFRLKWENGTKMFVDSMIDQPNMGEKYSGYKSLHGGINFKLKGTKRPITINCAPKDRNQVGQVTFHVNFTQFGPIAFGLVKEESYLTVDERRGRCDSIRSEAE